MSTVATTAADTPLPADTVIEPDQPDQPTSSILEHAKQFGPNADKSIESDEKPDGTLKPIRPVDQQKREQGKFAPGQQRMKSKDAVERINQLTGRAKTAEEALTRAQAELTQLRAERAAPQQIAKAEAKVERAETATAAASTFSEAEPDENDPKFGGDYAKYLRAAAAWEGRKAYFDEKQSERQQAERQQQEQAQHDTLKSWSSRVEAAKAKYQDFDAIAFGPTVIPSGSVIDQWIMEHKAGADVLYYLQAHRHELDSLLAKPVLEQVEDLTLLSQRLLSPPTGSAGSSTSATSRPTVVLPPRPPNVLRTEAQRANDPPPKDGSLSVTGHRKAFGPR